MVNVKALTKSLYVVLAQFFLYFFFFCSLFVVTFALAVRPSASSTSWVVDNVCCLLSVLAYSNAFTIFIQLAIAEFACFLFFDFLFHVRCSCCWLSFKCRHSFIIIRVCFPSLSACSCSDLWNMNMQKGKLNDLFFYDAICSIQAHGYNGCFYSSSIYVTNKAQHTRITFDVWLKDMNCGHWFFLFVYFAIRLSWKLCIVCWIECTLKVIFFLCCYMNSWPLHHQLLVISILLICQWDDSIRFHVFIEPSTFDKSQQITATDFGFICHVGD